jgi:hypothetical protein
MFEDETVFLQDQSQQSIEGPNITSAWNAD